MRPLLPEDFKNFTVAFINTAANPYETKTWLNEDRDKLVQMGFKVFDLDIEGKTIDELKKLFSSCNIIFVSGGNTFYLLDQAKKSGFLNIVPGLVNEGKIYIGSSAGSYLACPTIEVANWKHQDRNVVGITDFTALGLTNFLMSVHYKPEYNDVLREGILQAKYPVKILTDDQAVIVQDEVVKLVGIGEEINLS